jgi:hypothetical protein
MKKQNRIMRNDSKYFVAQYDGTGNFTMPTDEFDTAVFLKTEDINAKAGLVTGNQVLFLKSIVTTGYIVNPNATPTITLASGINGPILCEVSLGINNIGPVSIGANVPVSLYGPSFQGRFLGTQKYTWEDEEVVLQDGPAVLGSITYYASMSNIQPSGAGINGIFDAGTLCTYVVRTTMTFGVI